MEEKKTAGRRLFPSMPRTIQFTILMSFSLVAAVTTLLLGVSLYQLFASYTQRLMTESTEKVLGQTAVNLEDYLSSMRRISDAMYASSRIIRSPWSTTSRSMQVWQCAQA